MKRELLKTNQNGQWELLSKGKCECCGKEPCTCGSDCPCKMAKNVNMSYGSDPNSAGGNPMAMSVAKAGFGGEMAMSESNDSVQECAHCGKELNDNTGLYTKGKDSFCSQIHMKSYDIAGNQPKQPKMAKGEDMDKALHLAGSKRLQYSDEEASWIRRQESDEAKEKQQHTNTGQRGVKAYTTAVQGTAKEQAVREAKNKPQPKSWKIIKNEEFLKFSPGSQWSMCKAKEDKKVAPEQRAKFRESKREMEGHDPIGSTFGHMPGVSEQGVHVRRASGKMHSVLANPKEHGELARETARQNTAKIKMAKPKLP